MGGELTGMDRHLGAVAREKLSPPVARALEAFLGGRISAGSFSAVLHERTRPAARPERALGRRRWPLSARARTSG